MTRLAAMALGLAGCAPQTAPPERPAFETERAAFIIPGGSEAVPRFFELAMDVAVPAAWVAPMKDGVAQNGDRETFARAPDGAPNQQGLTLVVGPCAPEVCVASDFAAGWSDYARRIARGELVDVHLVRDGVGAMTVRSDARLAVHVFHHLAAPEPTVVQCVGYDRGHDAALVSALEATCAGLVITSREVPSSEIIARELARRSATRSGR